MKASIVSSLITLDGRIFSSLSKFALSDCACAGLSTTGFFPNLPFVPFVPDARELVSPS